MESRSFRGNGTNGCRGDWCKRAVGVKPRWPTARGLTDYDLPEIPPLYAALAEHFSQKQLAEIAATGINKNLWTRLKLAQSAIPVAESANSS
jgi:hypothetical protein